MTGYLPFDTMADIVVQDSAFDTEYETASECCWPESPFQSDFSSPSQCSSFFDEPFEHRSDTDASSASATSTPSFYSMHSDGQIADNLASESWVGADDPGSGGSSPQVGHPILQWMESVGQINPPEGWAIVDARDTIQDVSAVNDESAGMGDQFHIRTVQGNFVVVAINHDEQFDDSDRSVDDIEPTTESSTDHTVLASTESSV